MKPLVLIPARGGSKGVPGKNIKKLNGKPLIWYTLDAARSCFDDELIKVSTDDIKIKASIEELGFRVGELRPADLATDTADSYQVAMHVISEVEKSNYFPDTLILLQPTSPFRNCKHISEALKLYNEDLEMVVSVKEAKSNPYFTLMEEDEEGWLKKSKNANFFRRQDCPKIYEYNGAIYIINIAALRFLNFNQLTRVKKYVMDDISSLDIDTPSDWDYAEFLFSKLNTTGNAEH
jgi:CMP-N,N'-diacetyllegionaminic acid synthase